MKASLSVDVDPLDCYYTIHGLGTCPDSSRHVLQEKCLPRLQSWLAELNTVATLFVVGKELSADKEHAAWAQDIYTQFVAMHCEIASHSHSHPYDLARFSKQAVRDEIQRAHHTIAQACGVEPCGFRAPGYDISPTMIQALAQLGYTYDSSIFPSPPYYLAKLAVMAMRRCLGKKSGAVVTNPRALWSSRNPYQPGHKSPWKKGSLPLVEIPITVSPWLRIPIIGTSLLVAPKALRRSMYKTLRNLPIVNLEFHAIDFADPAADNIPDAIRAKQPDMKVSVQQKKDIFFEVVEEVLSHHDIVTLKTMAASLSPHSAS